MMFKREHVYVVVGSVIIAAVFLFANSFSTHPFVPCREWYIDSQIFQYMGFSMLNGKIPYTDLFDHKGLLLYAINALGFLIHQGWGVFILQILSFSATIMTWWIGLGFVKDTTYKILVLVSAVFCMYVYYSYGNSTEEWSLFFLSYPLMVYSRQLYRNGRYITNLNLFFIGICFGAIALLRLNNVAPIIGVVIYAAYKALRVKEYKYFLRAFGLILIGFLTPIIIASFYMCAVGGLGSLYDMYYATILFNIDYKAIYGGDPTFYDRCRFFYKSMLPALFLFIALKNRKDIVIPLLMGFLAVIPATGKAENYVYLLCCLPLMVYSMACLCSSRLRYLLLALLVCLHAKTFVKQASFDRFTENVQGNNVEAIREVLSHVPESDWDNIWQYGTCYMLKDFMALDILQPNRMFLNGQLNESRRLMLEEKNKIQEFSPLYILSAKYNKEEWMNKTRFYDGCESDIGYIEDNYSVVSKAMGEDETEIFLLKRLN